MRIESIVSGKKAYLNLLLLADPDEAMVDRYLDAGDMYVVFEGDIPVSEAVVTVREDGALELKNLATDERYQGRGYAGALVRHLCTLYRDRYDALYVGTADVGAAYYERLGFERAYVEKNFFTDNYPEPIYDRGSQCIDMVYLKKRLN